MCKLSLTLKTLTMVLRMFRMLQRSKKSCHYWYEYDPIESSDKEESLNVDHHEPFLTVCLLRSFYIPLRQQSCIWRSESIFEHKPTELYIRRNTRTTLLMVQSRNNNNFIIIIVDDDGCLVGRKSSHGRIDGQRRKGI